MTNLVLDATQYLLMAKLAARMPSNASLIFWKTLPDIVPDLTMHLPVMILAVRKESRSSESLLNELLSYPLPAVLSPETVSWRTELVAFWENRLKAEREKLMNLPDNEELSNGYISALGGLTHVDRCGLPSGLTCPSVLPTLLNEIRDIQKRHMDRTSEPGTWNVYRNLACFAVLANWHPGQNVVTDTATLREWGNFWLELYQSEVMIATDRTSSEAIIKKGLAAKALLKLTEIGSEEETGAPAGMETTLLTSLARAVEIAEKTNLYPLGWLNWYPQDVNRFPIDRLANLPETLLERIKIICQKPDHVLTPALVQSLSTALGEIVRWERSGGLAACRIDLKDRVLTDISGYLNNCIRNGVPSVKFMDYTLCRLFIRVAAVKEGKEGGELLQNLENYWQHECESEHNNWYSKFLAWRGRMELQRTGLSTETPSAFQENLLEAIKGKKSRAVQIAAQMMLSLWKPDIPQGVWEYLCHEQLKSDNKDICLTAALVLLKPNPADDLSTRQQKLLDVLHALPEKRRPSLSTAELAHLLEAMEKLPLKNLNAGFNADTNRTWQFCPDETRFRVPTEPAAPASTPTSAQIVRPDRTTQAVVGK